MKKGYKIEIPGMFESMAAEQPVGVFEVIQPLTGRTVAIVGDETVGLQQPCRPDKLVRVPPERGTGSGAAGA